MNFDGQSFMLGMVAGSAMTNCLLWLGIILNTAQRRIRKAARASESR